MFLKKHLLKQMLQYSSLSAIGSTINLPLTGFLERVILQETCACKCKSKAGNSSKVGVEFSTESPFVSEHRFKGATYAAVILKLLRNFFRSSCNLRVPFLFLNLLWHQNSKALSVSQCGSKERSSEITSEFTKNYHSTLLLCLNYSESKPL